MEEEVIDTHAVNGLASSSVRAAAARDEKTAPGSTTVSATKRMVPRQRNGWGAAVLSSEQNIIVKCDPADSSATVCVSGLNLIDCKSDEELEKNNCGT